MLSKLMARRKIRVDYQVHDMRRMNHWGYNAFFMSENTVCIFTPFGVREGDVVITKADNVLVTTGEVSRPGDPGDQYFVKVAETGMKEDELKPSTYKGTGLIG